MLNVFSDELQESKTRLAALPDKFPGMETFKQRMKRIRLRAGYASQQAAADAIGCERGTVGMWEAPSSNVSSVGEWLLQAASAYKVRPEWINNLQSTEDGYPFDSGMPSQQPSHSARWSPMILADAMTLLDQLDQILGRAIEPRPNPARLSIACEVVEAGGVNHREGVVVRLADRLRALEGKADGDGSGKAGGVGATDGGAHGAAPRAGVKGGRKR